MRLGRVIGGALVAAGLVRVGVAAPVWVALTSNRPAPPAARVLQAGADGLLLQIDVPGYWREVAASDGSERWTLPDGSWAWEEGQPQAPRWAVNIALPAAGAVHSEVVAASGTAAAISNYRLARVARFGAEPPAGTAPAVNAVVPGPYPPQLAVCGEPYRLRRVRGVTLQVHPFQFDLGAGRVRLTTQMVVRVRTAGSAWAVTGYVDADVAAFEEIYRRQFVNAPAPAARYTPLPETGRLLVIAYDAFYEAALPYVYWKRQKGIGADLVRLSEIGATASNVQAAIRLAYASNDVAYVQLVGDADQVPYARGTKGIMSNYGEPADPRYVLLAGDDYFPDAFIGRFPGRTAAEISNMVARTIGYEQAADAGGTWRHEACGVAGNLFAGGAYDYERMEGMRGVLTNGGYTQMDQIYWPSATVARVREAVNAGRGLVLFQGDGNATDWFIARTSVLGIADIQAFTNTGRLSFTYIVGCQNGAYHGVGDCSAEAWLKAGGITTPRGAVAVSASSQLQWALPPTTAQAEFAARLTAGADHTLGALTFNAIMKAVSLHTEPNPDPPGTTGEELYEQTHLFGDCSLALWTATPGAMTVAHTGLRYPGQGRYEVTVTDGPGALCALYDAAAHTLVGAAYADGGGRVVVPSAYTSSVPLVLTVTAFNRVPVMASVAFASNMVPTGLLLQAR